jgi:hypothetical protein
MQLGETEGACWRSATPMSTTRCRKQNPFILEGIRKKTKSPRIFFFQIIWQVGWRRSSPEDTGSGICGVQSRGDLRRQ